MHFNDLYGEFESNFDFGIDFDVLVNNGRVNDDTDRGDPSAIEETVIDVDWDDDQDIDDFINGSKAKNTVYKDTSSAKRLHAFMLNINPNETRKFYELPKPDLDKLLCRFFMYAKKIDKKSVERGDLLYQPDTLNSLRNGWQRVIDAKKLGFNIKTDPEFERSRKALKNQRKELTRKGLENKPNAARPLE